MKSKDYSIREISIGLKLFCTNKDDYDLGCDALTKKINSEYFTYGQKIICLWTIEENTLFT